MLLLRSNLPMAFHPSITEIKLCTVTDQCLWNLGPPLTKLPPLLPSQHSTVTTLASLLFPEREKEAQRLGTGCSFPWNALPPDTHLAHAFTSFRSWLKISHLLSDVYSACSPSNDESTVAIPTSPRTSSLLICFLLIVLMMAYLWWHKTIQYIHLFGLLSVSPHWF